MTTKAPESVQRFPLEWPLGWRRSSPASRKGGSFRMSVEKVVMGTIEKRQANVNMEEATDRLDAELMRLGATNVTLSTNVSLNLRGIPRGDQNPSDPGAAVYFSFKGKATVLACDSYIRVADNVAALAAHIDALRRIERYGVGTIEQALAGYKALPADTAANWRAVFGFAADARVSRDELDSAYKAAMKTRHPDVGGSEIEAAHVNRARDYALMELA